MKNNGKPLENAIKAVAVHYAHRNEMVLEKVDPPTRVICGHVKYMENPFLDFLGAWTERGGRAVFIEAKSTQEPVLKIESKGGLTLAQCNNLNRWANAGAATGIIWANGFEMGFVTLETLNERRAAKIKHIKWEQAIPLEPRNPMFPADFLPILRRQYPLASATEPLHGAGL